MEYYRQPPSDTLHALDSTPDGLTPAHALRATGAMCSPNRRNHRS
mgnify:CR=1 FL=1